MILLIINRLIQIQYTSAISPFLISTIRRLTTFTLFPYTTLFRSNRIHLVVLWHMHQPQYRSPENGAYVLPWTRLHALKDYWGMVKVLEEFPGVHAVFNMVPALGMQLEEYASGKFNEPGVDLASRPAEK